MARKQHRSLVRAAKVTKDKNQDEKLFSLLSSKPSSAFKALKSAKSSAAVQVPFIKVGDKKYPGERDADCLFDSLSSLKSLKVEQLESSPHQQSLMDDYVHIKSLCDNKVPLPPLSLQDSTNILKRTKPTVNDLFSITALHYIHAGDPGLVHFNLLMNTFILDVNNCTIEELNTVYALLI